MRVYGYVLLMTSHPANFGDHQHCGSGDIVFVVFPDNFVVHRHCGKGDIFLVCCVISRENVIKGSCNFFMGTIPSS